MRNDPSPPVSPHRPAMHLPAPVEAVWNPAARFVAAHRGLSDSALALLGVTTTALLGVIATDIFPTPGTSVQVPGKLLASFAVGLALLFLLIKLRAGRGTLYYFRVADEHWPELHGATLNAARARSLDYRSVTCAIDLGDQGTCDLIDLVADARGRLEQAANDDDVSTGFEFAPNEPFPVTVSVGC